MGRDFDILPQDGPGRDFDSLSLSCPVPGQDSEQKEKGAKKSSNLEKTGSKFVSGQKEQRDKENVFVPKIVGSKFQITQIFWR